MTDLELAGEIFLIQALLTGCSILPLFWRGGYSYVRCGTADRMKK